MAQQCNKPYFGELLTDWNKPSFEQHFAKMCDSWGKEFEEPLPFCAFPVAIVATVKIRQELNLPIPEHPLLELALFRLPSLAGRVRSEDAFFDQVNQ